MFGLPGQTLDHWRQTLEHAVQQQPDHLSCYLLTVDEKVPMGRDVARGRLVLPDDDRLAEMYELTRAFLEESGFDQYEVSNWARPGQASRHNLTYWRDGQWLGLGSGAASSYAGRRWKNTPSLERYIASVGSSGTAACVEEETPDLRTQVMDAITLGLRLREGIDLTRFAGRFDLQLLPLLGDEGASLLTTNILECDGQRLRVSAQHQLILNEVLVRLSAPIQERLATSASQIASR
jgi:oxygen-independent coproporphyrinogen-3 oxidase